MTLKTTIIVPCYNEVERLDKDTYINFFQTHPEISLLFVNDGSTDGTENALLQIEQGSPGNISLITVPKNVGKAEAVRQGVLAALRGSSDAIGFWDADLATPLCEILRFSRYLNAEHDRAMICGSRVVRLGAEIERYWYRHYLGRFIATLISMTLDLPSYDTQCGAKLFSRKLAQELFNEPFLSTWLFDVELLARIIALYGRSQASRMVFELPLLGWKDIGTSKVSPFYLFKIPFELKKIHKHYLKTI